MPLSEEELKRVLASKDIAQAFKKLESFLLEIRNHKYLLSSLFYKHYPDILATLLGCDERTKQASWLRLYPLSSTALLPVLDEKETRGSLFRVIFLYTSFPPKFELPLSALPLPTNRALQFYFSNPNNPAARSRLPPMFRGQPRLRSGGATVELSIYEYLFAALASLAVGFQPEPVPATDHRGIAAPQRVAPPAEEAYQHLLQEYLNFFLPHATGSSVAASRTGHSDAFLMCLTEFLLHHCGLDTIEGKAEFVMPTVMHLNAIRRFVTHLLADPASQALAAASVPRRDLMLQQCMTPDVLSIRRSLFYFIRACFFSWPQTEWSEQLAGVVRCWLAFLQPWRAPQMAQQLHARPAAAAPPAPGSHLGLSAFRQHTAGQQPAQAAAADAAYHAGWRDYVISNLPFYTFLFHELLLLLSDFTAAPSAAQVQLLQEIFSVYSEDLLAVLADCERALLLAPAAMHPHQHDSTVLLARRLQTVLAEFDLPFKYEPVFVEPPRTAPAMPREVRPARDLAVDLLRKLARTDRPRNPGLSPEEEKRLYTEAQNKLKAIFKLPDVSALLEEAPVRLDTASISWRALEPERDEKHRFRKLTRDGVEQLRLGLRVCSNLDVPFLGDVWKRPVASYEFGPLIPLLHRAALWLDGKLEKRYRLKEETREKLHTGIRAVASYPVLFWLFVFVTLTTAILWAVL